MAENKSFAIVTKGPEPLAGSDLILSSNKGNEAPKKADIRDAIDKDKNITLKKSIPTSLAPVIKYPVTPATRPQITPNSVDSFNSEIITFNV